MLAPFLINGFITLHGCSRLMLLLVMILCLCGCGEKTITWSELTALSKTNKLKVISMEGSEMLVVDEANGQKYLVPYMSIPNK
jgi:hypothetical protein